MYAIVFISDYVSGYIVAAGLSSMLCGICLSFLVILMIFLQPKRVNYYHTVMMLILAILCFLTALYSQSKMHWISFTIILFIGLLSTSPLLYAIAYVINNHAPCRIFRRCCQKLPKQKRDDDPELERLLETSNEE